MCLTDGPPKPPKPGVCNEHHMPPAGYVDMTGYSSSSWTNQPNYRTWTASDTSASTGNYWTVYP